MRPKRNEDESVQTSLRELMQQEEERVRAESDRLAHLRAAKIRIDEERAAAAREADEQKRAELEAKKAEATERARLELLARVEAEKRAAEIDERVRIAAVVATSANAVAPTQPPKPHRFVAGMMTGLTIATATACAFFFAHDAPRLAAQEKTTSELRADLDRARTELADLRNADHDAIAQRDVDNQTLRAERDRLRAALDATKTKPTKPPPTIAPIATATHHERCADPHDPLCGDLDAR